jgi:hypothetical protein
MQFRIDLRRTRGRLWVLFVPAFPSVLKRYESFPPALCAWSVPGCKSDGFVEEKQLCITARGHYGALPASEFQTAGDPTPAFELAHDLAFLVVQPAPIAHERSPGGRTKNSAVGVHPIL